MGLEAENGSDDRKAFARYLRTGIPAPRLGELELKFNPYHDPRNGRFTFKNGVGPEITASPPSRKPPTNAGKALSPKALPHSRRSTAWGGGGFTGGGGGSFGGGGASSIGFWLTNAEAESFRRRYPSMVPDVVDAQDTLATVARRHNISQATLAKVNGLAVNAKVKPGDVLAVPRTPVAKQSTQPVKQTTAMAKRQGPSESRYHHIIKHGYDFAIDAEGRTRSVDGELTNNPDQRRSRQAQLEAGRPDRLPTDEGGHYIARRFNGPTDAFNHFAQNGNFNRSRYARLENTWAREMSDDHKVHVHIIPIYKGASKRPEAIVVRFEIDGFKSRLRLPNSAGVQ